MAYRARLLNGDKLMEWTEDIDGGLVNLNYVVCIFRGDNERECEATGHTGCIRYTIDCMVQIAPEDSERVTLAEFRDETARDAAYAHLKTRLSATGTIHRVSA